MDYIVEFIHRRFKTDCNWIEGNCYYFAVILKERFPELEIIYCPIQGHFMVMDLVTRVTYDWAGAHSAAEQPYYLWDNLKDTEPELYKRIVYDCTR